MIQSLDADDWKIAARSVTPAEAAAVLADMAGRDTTCPPAEAAELAANLIALWPGKDLANPDAYAAAVTALFAAYPRDIVKRVCNPVTGLPSRLKFFPVIADLAEALRTETDRRKRIAANARTVLEQAEKARQKAEEDAQWARQLPPPEERARRVQELLKGAVKPP